MRRRKLPHQGRYNRNRCSWCGKRYDPDLDAELMWVEELSTHVHEDELDQAYTYADGAKWPSQTA